MHTQASHAGLPASPLANRPPRVILYYGTQTTPLRPSRVLPVALRKFFKVLPRASELPPSSLPHCRSHRVWTAGGFSTCSTLSLKCSTPTSTELIVTSSGRTHSAFPDHPSPQPPSLTYLVLLCFLPTSITSYYLFMLLPLPVCRPY